VKRIIVISILLLSIQHTHAQYDDARLWLSANFKKSLGLKTSLHFEQGFRLSENYTQLNTVYSEIGVRYRIGQKWRVGGFYRFSQRRNEDPSFRTRHRFHIDLAYKQKLGGKLDFTFRGRYQSQYTDFYSDENGRIATNRLRFKTIMKIDLDKRYTPYLAVEYFYRLYKNMERNKFDNSRYVAGATYDLTKRSQIDIYYMLIRQLNRNNPGRYYVIGLDYSYSF
jgi:hypothetical protein